MTVIQFPKLQADTCRLHNRQFEMRARERILTEEEWQLIDPPKARSFPTPFGWFLIAMGYWMSGEWKRA
jgi:hypothetical protein